MGSLFSVIAYKEAIFLKENLFPDTSMTKKKNHLIAVTSDNTEQEVITAIRW